MPDQPRARFMTLEPLAEELATSVAQVLALMKRRELEAVQIGGRRQSRVERSKLESYNALTYTDTAARLDKQPCEGEDVAAAPGRHAKPQVSRPRHCDGSSRALLASTSPSRH